MLKIEIEPCLVIALLLIGTPTIADVTRELERCELEAERLYLAPHNKGLENWPEREANQRKRAETTEAPGYSLKAECSVPLKTYESCMKIDDDLMRGAGGGQYRDIDWNKICLENEWDVRTQERLSANCYQRSWWRHLLGRC